MLIQFTSNKASTLRMDLLVQHIQIFLNEIAAAQRVRFQIVVFSLYRAAIAKSSKDLAFLAKAVIKRILSADHPKLAKASVGAVDINFILILISLKWAAQKKSILFTLLNY